jgi:Predicted transcriptional regulators
MMIDQLRETWGHNLRRARMARHLSLAQVSALTRVDPGQLSRVENGEAGLGDEYRLAVAAALGVRVEDIWSYPEPEQVTP